MVYTWHGSPIRSLHCMNSKEATEAKLCMNFKVDLVIYKFTLSVISFNFMQEFVCPVQFIFTV